jgi:hypothetical protein
VILPSDVTDALIFAGVGILLASFGVGLCVSARAIDALAQGATFTADNPLRPEPRLVLVWTIRVFAVQMALAGAGVAVAGWWPGQ